MDDFKNKSFLNRLGFACAGMAHGLRTERSLRTQALALVLVFVLLAIARPTPVWWAIVILASTAVLAAELLNTAVERMADHLHPDIHPQIGIIKDCAAAAVLISSVGAVGVAIALVVELVHR